MSVNILKAIDDKRLFGSALRDPTTWRAWRTFCAVLFGLGAGLTAEDVALFTACTGRSVVPTKPFQTAYLICGRRAGKSFTLALLALYLACFKSYTQYLQKRERAVIMVIAADRRQSRQIIKYVKGLLEIPALSKLLEGETADSVDIAGQVTIEVGTASHRTVRGYSLAAALCDEMAFWPQESSTTPDVEILAALRPAMANIPGALLLCASSPFAKRGALYDAFTRYYGKDDENVLVWRAATRVMNSTVPQKLIDDAMAADANACRSEFYAEFRSDIEQFLSRTIVDAAIDRGVLVRPPRPHVRYAGYVDSASGVGQDSHVVAIGHAEADTLYVDLIHEIRPPFNPTSATAECCALLKSYGVSTVHGDKYAPGFVIDAHAKCGVTYQYSERDTSENYLGTLPLLTSGRVRLVENERAVLQFSGLQRKISPGGRDRVSHPVGNEHDDISAAISGLLVSIAGNQEPGILVHYRMMARAAAATVAASVQSGMMSVATARSAASDVAAWAGAAPSRAMTAIGDAATAAIDRLTGAPSRHAHALALAGPPGLIPIWCPVGMGSVVGRTNREYRPLPPDWLIFVDPNDAPALLATPGFETIGPPVGGEFVALRMPPGLALYGALARYEPDGAGMILADRAHVAMLREAGCVGADEQFPPAPPAPPKRRSALADFDAGPGPGRRGGVRHS